ncbi:S phase cyclin A-associated protein in the endoplasmic reticulum [Papilio machaon]|uniref:S phase cyclin A-associated protein in the endoplasmic reticulum n=1 Tax=Papilio machaon TaxID=76193 RepID=A0A0N1IHP7_PAPMA|nr:S phase cyclin A-associated protein in the endoplasmic reticulum [Papilio machaon]
MEEVRQLVQEEGREARNLVAFHVAVDTPSRVSRKPPRAAPPPRRAPPRAARLRSASAGRDKRSELRARYWALLFGDLQRAVGEIYNTVEAHENLNECQEVILVLENYTRDFKALGEWFRLKWEYDNTPPPQRPQSLAWEIRKTDFVRPESRRTHSVKSSPSVSGKNSPCLSGHNTPSGKNSPNLTGKASPGSGKISPRISTSHSSTSPKANIEFFTNKVVSKITAKPEPKSAKETTRLSDIKERDVKETDEKMEIPKEKKLKNDLRLLDNTKTEKDIHKDVKSTITVEIGKAKELPTMAPKQVVIKSSKSKPNSEKIKKSDVELSNQAKATISVLEAMENELLTTQLMQVKVKNENFLNEQKEIQREEMIPENSVNEMTSIDGKSVIQSDEIDTTRLESNVSPTKSEENFADISNESSPKTFMGKEEKISNQIIKNGGTDIVAISERNGQNIESDIMKDANSLVANKTNIIHKNQNGVHDDICHVTESIISVTSEINNTDEAEKNGPRSSEVTKISINENQDHNETVVNDMNNMDKNKKEIIENGVIHEENLDHKGKLNKEQSEVINKTTSVCSTNKTKTINESKCPDKQSEHIKKTNTETKEELKKEHDSKKSECKPILDSKTNIKPAYSQAAAKPKSANVAKTEIKTPTRTALIRSSTVVEMRPTTAPRTQRPFQKRNQMNKCSYPFNLTTSRTSLFQTPPATNTVNKVTLPKRPINKINHLASGDTKAISNRGNINKRPPRPTSLKINGKGDKKESANSTLNKIKDSVEYSSCDTIVTQIDMSRIESSESLKTLVPDDTQLHDIANSIEVLNVDEKNDNEGWLTVKSKRLSRESKKQLKSHWANRFNQPSATTSLPTLNMLESPKEENIAIVESAKTTKIDRAKSEQPETAKVERKVEKVVKVLTTPKAENKAKDPAMIRQKSDVTGLKTKPSRTRLTRRAGKIKDATNDEEQSELTKNRLHSSLESLTTGLARSQESTEETFDFDKWKAEFKSTFKYLDEDDQTSNDTEILKTADPSEMSEIAEMTSQIEENEKKMDWALDLQSEADQKKLCEEEDLLNRQILELQQVSDIDVDTETDDTETDAEIVCEDVGNTIAPSESLGSLAASLEDQYETALAGMSWAERVDTLGVLEALVARDPVERYRHLIDDKKLRINRRLAKAAENRDQHLKGIVRKAHDEEEKLREIAFIKQLEAENRRLEFLAQCRAHTSRLRTMRRERLEKLEEKSAREAAVWDRRRALEAARLNRVESIVERRRLLHERAQGMRDLRKQERDDAAREKTTSESHEQNEEEEAKRYEQERRERERQKNIKKKARKLRLRLLNMSHNDDQIPTYDHIGIPFGNKMFKVIQQICNIITPLYNEQDTTKQNGDTEDKCKKNKILNGDIHDKQTDKQNGIENNNNTDMKIIEEKVETKKKKKKNKEVDSGKENAKNNAPSVCSSQSDTSRSSKKETKVCVTFDQVLLERNLNELYRMIEKIDKLYPELSVSPSVSTQKMYGLRAIGQMLALASQREDLAAQFTPKSHNDDQIPTYDHIGIPFDMKIIEEKVETKKKKKKNKEVDSGKENAKNNAPSVCSSQSDTSRSSKKETKVCVTFDQVLLERNLNELYRMIEKIDKEKNLQDDNKETELARYLSDCVSVALDSVLCATRLYEDGTSNEDAKVIGALRNRAHLIIRVPCANSASLSPIVAIWSTRPATKLDNPIATV